jgi:hypothetical protein
MNCNSLICKVIFFRKFFKFFEKWQRFFEFFEKNIFEKWTMSNQYLMTGAVVDPSIYFKNKIIAALPKCKQTRTRNS